MAKRKIKIVEAPYIPINEFLEKRKEKQKDCEHNRGSNLRCFMHQEIERKGQYCNECNLLLDYWPQYSEDDL